MNKRKRLISYSLVVLISSVLLIFPPVNNFIGVSQVSYVQAKTKSTTVYISETGTKYHKKSCKSIKKSKNLTKTTVKKAKADDYSACKVCKP